MAKRKLFKVKKLIIPEWGSTEVEFTKYFIASKEETVRSIVLNRYGGDNHCYSMDRMVVKFEITQLKVEVL